ncbi:MAG TPA: hypothetical protein VES68_02035 [Candidatus Sulfotelmatobacter sp.]|nr:hypothetical protein [Candidatus Sulfotelmatobacter sp.]
MAVVVNQQPQEQNNQNSFLSGLILLIVFVILVGFLIIYLLPRIGYYFGKPQINIPNKFDVNVHQTK